MVVGKSILSGLVIKVPGPWNGYSLENRKMQAKNLATYHLRLFLPDEGEYSLHVPQIATAYLLFVNGIPVASNGIVHPDLSRCKPQFLPLVADFHSRITNDIVFWVANPNNDKGGMWLVPQIGPRKTIHAARENSIAVDCFTIGVLLIMAFYHIGLWILRPQDRSSIYFALFCLLTAVRTSVNGEMYLLQLFPNLPWEWNVKLDYMSIPSAAAFLLFVQSIYRQKLSKPIIQGLCGILLIFTVMVLFLPNRIYGIIQTPFLFLTLIGCICVLVIVISRIFLGDMEAALMLSGFVVLVLTVLNDILFALRVFTAFGNITAFGLVLFIFFQSFVLSLRSSRAFRTAETLSISLESEVKERTLELVIERNLLSKQNHQMMGELQMARKIQDKLIPKESPLGCIAYWYQPMLQVGGDFFDFIRLRNGRIGIFISDVSGHGMAAALVTSMIKSYTMQYLPEIDNPAEVLHLLNDFLCDMDVGQFVTAFYLIYDPRTREMTWASAGHNIPFQVISGELVLLPVERKGFPLAVMKNRELMNTGKPYFNETGILPEHSRLLLYTDGLLETVNINDKEISGDKRALEEFEYRALGRVIRRCGGLNADKLIPEIVKSLIAFRGGKEFDDDVCIICIDTENVCES